MPVQDCPAGYYWDEAKKKCRLELYDPSGGGYEPAPPGGKQKPEGFDPTADPGGSFTMPCPPDQCKDVVSEVCRSYNPKREKVNMTDDIHRESGGGRGYCRKKDGGGGGGFGGGGGAGGGGGGGPHSGPLGPGGGGTGGGAGAAFQELLGLGGVGGELSQQMEAFLKGVLGGQTRYSPEVMQDIQAGYKAETEGQVNQSTAALNEDLARRGLYRSPVGADQAVDIRLAGDQRFSEGTRQLRVEKATRDFEDKLSAVDRGQKYLDSLRSYVAQLDVTQAEREKLKATIELGYARIDAEMKMLMKQLASQKDLLQLSIGSQEKIAQWGINSSNWQLMQGLLYGQ